jgi:hypothetical protein
LIEIPRIRLEGDPKNPQEVPDFESKVTLLAYLLHKGLVTGKDTPPYDPEKDFKNPFDRTIFRFAQSPHYQNKIRKELGEPSLPEAQNADRGTGLI